MQSVILRHLSSSDKDQECDISEAQLETDGGTTGVEVDAGQLGKVGAQCSRPPPPCCHHILFLVNKQVMSTIKGVGNKPLQHANSVTSLPSPAKLPKYNSKLCSLYLFFVGIFHFTLTSPGTGWSPPTRTSSACTWTTLPGNAQLIRLPDPLVTSGLYNLAYLHSSHLPT